MKVFAWNLMLALAWAAVTGELSAVNLAVGFLLGYLVTAWLSPDPATKAYVRRTVQVVRFAAFYAKELFLSTLQVSWEVVTPRRRARPGLVALPLEASTAAEITLFANLLSFTPGSLSLDVSADRKFLLVHGLFVEDPEAYKAALKRDFERRVLELLR